MPVIKIEGFSGIAPKLSANLLANNQAQTAANAKLMSGEIRPWRKESAVAGAIMMTGAVTAYRLINASSEKWLSWDMDVDVVQGQISDTTDYRVYYTGDTTPRKTNWTTAATAARGDGSYPGDYQLLGVVAPTGAPTVANDATAGPAGATARTYVYTYVNTFGSVKEESAPSPASAVISNVAGQSIKVTWAAPPGTAHTNITHVRIYRAESGGYVYVTEISVTTPGLYYIDSLASTALGGALPSTYWDTPGNSLTGLIAMPNGILAGFAGNNVYFCEPYYPHAWPASYSMSVSYPIVGLGVYGSTLVVLTTANPYLISGTHPSSMTQEKLPMLEPCIAKKSIAHDQYGVLYASPNGLVSIGPSEQDVVTRPLYSRDDWQKLFPSTIQGRLYSGVYFGFFAGGLSFVLSRAEQPSLCSFSFAPSAVYVDHTTAKLYAVQASNNALYQLDADPLNNTVAHWKSKRYRVPSPTTFSAFQLDADYSYMGDLAVYQAAYNAAVAARAALWPGDLTAVLNSTDLLFNLYMFNGDSLTPLPAQADTRYITVTVYAEGVLVCSNSVTAIEPVRIPVPTAGEAFNWEVLIAGNAAVRSFSMATTIAELAGL